MEREKKERERIVEERRKQEIEKEKKLEREMKERQEAKRQERERIEREREAKKEAERIEMEERKKREEAERLEKEYKEKIAYENFKEFYKRCLNEELLLQNFEDNKEKILKVAESFKFENDDINDIIDKIYNMEKIKNIIFSNYYFVNIVKAMIKYKVPTNTSSNNHKIYEFIYLIETLYSTDIASDFSSSVYKRRAKVFFDKFFKDGKFLAKVNFTKDTEIKTAFDGLLYYNYIMNIIKSDEELDTICQNLFKTYLNNKYIDFDYISKKMYDIYCASYAKKYHINVSQKDFENIFVLMQEKKKKKKIYSNYYELVFKEYKTVKDFSKEMYDGLILSKQNKVEDIYYCCIVDKKGESSLCEICECLLNMDGRIEEYNTMIKEEREKIDKAKIKKEKQKQHRDEKKKLEQDRIRLIKGDFSKEIKINDAIQEKKRQKKEIELGYQDVENGYEFEEYVAKLYEKLGYKTEVTRKSGDQGADIIANKDNKKYVIQAKFYSSPVSNKAVQEVVASMGMYNADCGIVVTNNTYTSSAVELAKANNIELVDGNKIEEFKKELIAKI